MYASLSYRLAKNSDLHTARYKYSQHDENQLIS
ncbi:MAG: hypothetical protein ACI93H_000046 [Psychromonas sp.]|jgi:hypothetical protein